MKICQNLHSAVGCIFLIATLAGCGGGGGSEDDGIATPTPITGLPVQGLYAGSIQTLPATADDGFLMLILDDGTFWHYYGTERPDRSLDIAGFAQGTLLTSMDTILSNDSMDFGTPTALAAPLAAGISTTPVPTTEGTFSLNAVNVVRVFNGGIPVGITYDYKTAASVTTVAGSWTLTLAGGEVANINVSTVGDVGGTGSSGCQFNGKVTPHPSGKNVFSTRVTFGASPCALAGQTLNGIGIAYALEAGGTRLVVSAVNAARTSGFAAFGTR